MANDILSRTALTMLHNLIDDERHSIRCGAVAYGTPQDTANALEALDELDEMAAAIAGAGTPA